ncbi:MAG: hypothetical protein IT461_16520 [Planctomycetes bacterium]|nr:hypothetical protein [Planctomycetota bacterium]
MSPSQSIPRNVAVIDDDENMRGMTAEFLRDASFEPIIRKDTIDQLPQFVNWIRTNKIWGAICDHRLSTGGLSIKFSGAEIVSTLFKENVPAVLLSRFDTIDADATIRPYRRYVPKLLSPEESGAEALHAALDACAREITGTVPLERKSRRVLVRVLEKSNEANKEMLDVMVPTWRTTKAVRFPLDLIEDAALRKSVGPKSRLFVHVNIDAERSEDLFFHDFERATEKDDKDGLA